MGESALLCLFDSSSLFTPSTSSMHKHQQSLVVILSCSKNLGIPHCGLMHDYPLDEGIR